MKSLKTFETVDGFRMELVAAEPLVQSPVAAAFDADGNLYVAEMRDYPYKPKPGGTSRWERYGCCGTPTATAGLTRATSLPMDCSGLPASRPGKEEYSSRPRRISGI